MSRDGVKWLEDIVHLPKDVHRLTFLPRSEKVTLGRSSTLVYTKSRLSGLFLDRFVPLWGNKLKDKVGFERSKVDETLISRVQGGFWKLIEDSLDEDR